MVTTSEESVPSRAVAMPGQLGVLATGVIGAVLLAMASVSAGSLPAGVDNQAIPVLGHLASAPTLALTCALVGMGLLVLAWLALGRFALARDGEVLPLKRIYQALVAWCAPLLVVPPLFSGDVYSYIAQGAIAERGLDPYTLGPAQALGGDSEFTRNVSEYWLNTPSPYGPAFGALERLITQAAGENPVVAVLLHRVVELGGLALIVFALGRLARRAGVPVVGALWLGALSPLVLFHFVAGIHNDALMLGLMAAGVALALDAVPRRGQGAADGGEILVQQPIAPLPLLGGVVLTSVAATVKLTAALALVVVAIAIARALGGKVAHLAVAAVGVFGAFAVLTVAVSWASGFGLSWIGGLSTPGTVNSWLAPTNQLGFLVGGIGSLFGVQITQAAIVVGKVLGALMGVLVGAKLIWEMLRGRVAGVLGLGLLFALMIVCGPTVQPWYVLWVAVPLAACLRAGRVRQVLIGVLAVFAVSLPPTGASFAGRVGELILGYGSALVVLAVVAVFGYRWLRPSCPPVEG